MPPWSASTISGFSLLLNNKMSFIFALPRRMSTGGESGIPQQQYSAVLVETDWPRRVFRSIAPSPCRMGATNITSPLWTKVHDTNQTPTWSTKRLNKQEVQPDELCRKAQYLAHAKDRDGATQRTQEPPDKQCR